MLLAFVQNPLTLIKRLSFDQSLRESTKKTRKNPINIPRNQRRKGRKKERKNMGKYSINRLYCEDSRASYRRSNKL
jgi:hypothetical protein